jgi:hypothetical protein
MATTRTHESQAPSLNRLAVSATTHCLIGCAIGEFLGMILATAFGWGNVAQTALAIVLAYFFGFGLTAMPLVRAGLAFGVVVSTALAADTVSITIMEAIDNLTVLLIPNAMDAGLTDPPLLRQHRRGLRHRLSRRLPGEPLPDRPREGPRSRA